ncbi:MAG: homoserine O-acetyltransferase [Fibrobacter sp.]|jgi:homoserine O-acetyltransferase|nr:homoserine O-acetyltransferase [Fibrobacter sp.]
MQMSEFLHKDSLGPVVPQDMKIELGSEGFLLEGGGRLKELSIRYETYGELNKEADNVIWICSPLTADAHVAGFYKPDDKKVGWWDALIGKGKAIDTDHFFVVCSNILGGCKGTTGPASINPETLKPYGASFPNITIGDMVQAQKKLADGLGIKKIFCVIGGSMGGFQAMKWSILYPEEVERCIIIASSPRFSSQALGFEIVGRDAIKQDPNFNGGDYYEGEIPAVGLSNARKIAHLTYLSRVGMEAKFTREACKDPNPKEFLMGFPLESYLAYQGAKFVERFDANSYLHITYATDTFDLETEYGSLEKAFKKTNAKFLNITLSTDWLFPPHESRKITHALVNAEKEVTSLELDTLFGHDGFLLEVGDLGKAISAFISPDPKLNQHSDTQAIPVFHDTEDFDLLETAIPNNSRILDLGCGNGDLIERLKIRKNVQGLGVDKNFNSILSCLRKGVPVIQKDLDEGLKDFGNHSFDFAILNRTLQEVNMPLDLLHEILRVAGKAVITFPNFGHWSVRAALCRFGRMPKSSELPYEWYNTPNIHLFTLRDFIRMCESENLTIEKLYFDNDKLFSKILTSIGRTNLGAERVVALVSKKDK